MQSRTLPSEVGHAYVQLFRAIRRYQLSILRYFTIEVLQTPLSESLIPVLEGKKSKAEETKLLYRRGDRHANLQE